jgi:hypothetical protein
MGERNDRAHQRVDPCQVIHNGSDLGTSAQMGEGFRSLCLDCFRRGKEKKSIDEVTDSISLHYSQGYADIMS